MKHNNLLKEKYIKLAIKEAEKAYSIGEIPIGCIIVKDDIVIAKAHNEIELRQDVTKHAELIAISKASKKLDNWRLLDCDMYVTLEPCNMCNTAIKLSRIKNVYYILENNNKIENSCMNNKIDLFNEEYSNLIKTFFENIRK